MERISLAKLTLLNAWASIIADDYDACLGLLMIYDSDIT